MTLAASASQTSPRFSAFQRVSAASKPQNSPGPTRAAEGHYRGFLSGARALVQVVLSGEACLETRLAFPSVSQRSSG
jgi:hypothetical protein